ncbi:hypothetical protein A2X44_05310 [candidate division CPR3 bacterium GWF2_35_18]|uniref:DNA mismatch repair protein MutL n=1 Tax=candidate division CPR3 bacterium GW2011_GWF2_35_18 TaxID=1618350 RepID=A0A0G0BZ14_UNCC3|nr:MAG: mismatch repair protein MutL protein [candidate division CPR3 bacterium GW2011_GWF2_35_18]OGB63817.1 MAG: hypothetical protein A2X44_05310 [candidate division CPR3 bacterium GWF2_35_18]OGB65204.1 MAG: hypothetical protein A2250_03060 [candidate division CPR3 bacterium RIFOXYA2_FULL_35_13]OGB76152.1 MAG: hypothetical protein A2476_00285 [candidate division CPR3 bacterium RIFOXYC2_FULL_35_7]OGB79407.1 MAG: hypothetical protein A2296_04765 [candidate division CPR3 bacterium RIFOXYB2_FULL_3
MKIVIPEIKILSPEVIKQIAAGEVVENPASILKELLENSIDAGSSVIKVFLEKGGLIKIQVIDNGFGIKSSELPLAFERHATSKISAADDLLHLNSLGFRGEALYSIAAVSKVRIETKQKTEIGAVFTISGEEKGELKKVGCPEGTAVTVSEIFFNIPARQKFLKSVNTELKYCREIFIAEALSHPQIRFELFNENKKLFQLPVSSFKERIVSIFELEEQDLLPVLFNHEYLKITGFLGKPGISRTRKNQQFLIVNSRSVTNKLVFSAVKQGYGSYLPIGSYPVFFLNFEIRADLIDINIHPRKEEVKFAVNDLIFNGVKVAVSKALEKIDLTPAAGVERVFEQSRRLHFSEPSIYEHQREFVTPKMAKQAFEFNEKISDVSLKESDAKNNPVDIEPQKFPWEETEESCNSSTSQLFQLDFVYIIEIKGSELFIYDQHAVHERVLFEKFIHLYLSQQKQGETQALLFPEEVELSSPEREIILKEKDKLQKLGFGLEVEDKKVLIKEIPIVLNSDNLKSRFRDFLDGLISHEEFTIEGDWKIDRKTLRMLTFLSCRSAIKAGDKLEISEMRNLLQQFEITKEKYTCPHGRPVVVRLGRKQLDKLFLRDKKSFKN